MAACHGTFQPPARPDTPRRGMASTSRRPKFTALTVRYLAVSFLFREGNSVVDNPDHDRRNATYCSSKSGSRAGRWRLSNRDALARSSPRLLPSVVRLARSLTACAAAGRTVRPCGPLTIALSDRFPLGEDHGVIDADSWRIRSAKVSTCRSYLVHPRRTLFMRPKSTVSFRTSLQVSCFAVGGGTSGRSKTKVWRDLRNPTRGGVRQSAKLLWGAMSSTESTVEKPKHIAMLQLWHAVPGHVASNLALQFDSARRHD